MKAATASANTQCFPTGFQTHKCEGRCRFSAGASLHSKCDHGSGNEGDKERTRGDGDDMERMLLSEAIALDPLCF